MQGIIDEGVEYDVANVSELLSGTYWQLDAVLGYNDDYTRVENVYRDFAVVEAREDDDLIFAFCSNGVIHCSDINAEDGTIVEQVGDWNYNGRTLELVISVLEFGDNITMEFRAKLLSLTPESAVLEWSGNDGQALRASLRPASYDEHQKKSVNIASNPVACPKEPQLDIKTKRKAPENPIFQIQRQQINEDSFNDIIDGEKYMVNYGEKTITITKADGSIKIINIM